jgi:hypothetical protein
MNWLKQKTTWTGLTAIAVGALLIYKGNLNEGVQTVIGGFGLIFVREAIAGIKK